MTRDNDCVTGIVLNATGFCQNLQNSYLAIRLIDHRVVNRPDHSDWLALSLFDSDTDVRMSNKPIGFQDFCNFLLCLEFGQTSDPQSDGNKRQSDGAGLAHA